MKRRFPTGLARALQRFFQEYLPVQRGMSLHTLRSYRDALLLLLRYTAQDTRRRIEALELDDFTAERVTRFLRHLETQRQEWHRHTQRTLSWVAYLRAILDRLMSPSGP